MIRPAAFAVLAAAAWIASAAPARAALDVYPFEGVIDSSDFGVLFGSKLPGQTFSGTLTIDTQATPVSITATTTSWDGTFALSVEGVAYPVSSFRVWSGGPVGPPDGFEFGFTAGGESGFLSLRSSSDLYAQPLLPTDIEIGVMDVLAQISVGLDFPTFATDRGTITFVPEPGRAALGLAALAVLAGLRVRAHDARTLRGRLTRSPARRPAST